MEMREVNTLILNPKSANRPELRKAVRAVTDAGFSLRVRIPWDTEDNIRVVREAIEAGAKRLIAGGGDGTINTVVNALVGDGSEPPKAELGILPLGTANDFARGCKLPTDDLEQCLKIACSGVAQPVDVGRMNGRNFINVASLGYGAEVTATTPRNLKEAMGGGAYTLMGLATAMKFQPYMGHLLVSGSDEPNRGEMLIGAVGNNRFAGGGFEVAPKASITDGLLDLAVISHNVEFKVSTVLKELKNPFHEENRYVTYRQLSEFTIECDNELFCNLDGESIKARQLRFSVLPAHLKLVMPSASGT